MVGVFLDTIRYRDNRREKRDSAAICPYLKLGKFAIGATDNVKNPANGQVLVIAIITFLILLIAVIFLYDLHSIIRVKIKAQTAADAAALTAANWQRYSLNLIGELNLVKACTVLVSDIAPIVDSNDLPDSQQAITTASEILTEMQARISFVGPMIGFGAAQQAAKNNGMNSVSHFNKVVFDHLFNLYPAPDGRDYYSDDNGINQFIQGYSWKSGYIQMIQSVLNAEPVLNALGGQGGIAAAPNVDFASIPKVNPEWLLKVGLYRAIDAEYWCYPKLLELVKHPSPDLNGSWWLADVVQNTARFPEECEYSPIYIEYSKVGDTNVFDDGNVDNEKNKGAKKYLHTEFNNGIADIRGWTLFDKYEITDFEDKDKIKTSQPLQYIKWCIYDPRWAGDLPSPEWTDKIYLRSEMKKEYIYGGALAKMQCYATPTAMSSNYNAGKMSFRDLEKNDKGAWLSASPASIASVTCTALAKPLGSLAPGVPPCAVNMVLPVFNQGCRLIPVAMQDPTGLYDPFDQEQYNLFIFLKWLKDYNIDIGELVPPNFEFKPIDGCPNDSYLWALQKLNTASWRARGYNPDYPYILDAQPGWLQVKRTYTKKDKDGNNITFTDTNEYSCTDWGDQYGGSGYHDGPTKLH